ncbi:MAG: hypothetical protein AAFP26_00950 [Planctomycetota bacterium]
MPWGDWQFWLVTLAAIGGLALIVRAVLPKRKRGKKTSLTISARRHAAQDPNVH